MSLRAKSFPLMQGWDAGFGGHSELCVSVAAPNGLTGKAPVAASSPEHDVQHLFLYYALGPFLTCTLGVLSTQVIHG